MDNGQIEDLLTLIGAVVALGAGYARLFGARQTQVVEWVVAGFRVKGRWRGLVNLAVGLAIAGAVSAYAAWRAGEWALFAAGLLAGLLASDEAARVHDESATKERAAKPATKQIEAETG